jgi:hypothetical protein
MLSESCLFSACRGIVSVVPVLVLAPYLPLRKTADIGPYRLTPFRLSEQLDFLSEGIRADTQLLIGAYRIEQSTLGAVVVKRDRPIGEDIVPEDVWPLHRALLLGVLESNPDRPDDPGHEPEDLNAGHKMATAESALVYGHPVRGDGTFATQTGFMAPSLAVHGRVRPGDQVRIAPPGELPAPILAKDLDSEYASAALAVMTKDDETGRRVGRAADWLDMSWQNTTTVGHDVRILALRCGFDVLLSATDRGDETRQIRASLSSLLDPSDAERTPRTWHEHGTERKADLTDLEWWFQQFTLLRNAIAHGHLVTAAQRRAEDGRLHLLVGERTLRAAIKRTIARGGYPFVEDDLFGRLLPRYLEERKAEDKDVDAA